MKLKWHKHPENQSHVHLWAKGDNAEFRIVKQFRNQRHATYTLHAKIRDQIPMSYGIMRLLRDAKQRAQEIEDQQ